LRLRRFQLLISARREKEPLTLGKEKTIYFLNSGIFESGNCQASDIDSLFTEHEQIVLHFFGTISLS